MKSGEKTFLLVHNKVNKPKNKPAKSAPITGQTSCSKSGINSELPDLYW